MFQVSDSYKGNLKYKSWRIVFLKQNKKNKLKVFLLSNYLIGENKLDFCECERNVILFV